MIDNAGTTRARRARAGLAAAALYLFAAGAQAQYPCNGAGPGRDVVGMTQAGQGIAAMPLCVDRAAPASPQAAPATPSDPMRAMVGEAYAQMSQRFQNAQRMLEERQRIDRDPQNRGMVEGQWSFFPKAGGGRDDSCAAMFSNRQGVVRIMGPGPGFKGATLTFWGSDIPKPKALQTVPMTLLQPKAPPSTVPALNYYHPDERLGAIVFVVPSIEAALGAFEETQHFEVAQNGKSLIQIDWTGGDAARETLRQCVQRHPH